MLGLLPTPSCLGFFSHKNSCLVIQASTNPLRSHLEPVFLSMVHSLFQKDSLWSKHKSVEDGTLLCPKIQDREKCGICDLHLTEASNNNNSLTETICIELADGHQVWCGLEEARCHFLYFFNLTNFHKNYNQRAFSFRDLDIINKNSWEEATAILAHRDNKIRDYDHLFLVLPVFDYLGCDLGLWACDMFLSRTFRNEIRDHAGFPFPTGLGHASLRDDELHLKDLLAPHDHDGELKYVQSSHETCAEFAQSVTNLFEVCVHYRLPESKKLCLASIKDLYDMNVYGMVSQGDVSQLIEVVSSDVDSFHDLFGDAGPFRYVEDQFFGSTVVPPFRVEQFFSDKDKYYAACLHNCLKLKLSKKLAVFHIHAWKKENKNMDTKLNSLWGLIDDI
jgi:hypothetical protein